MPLRRLVAKAQAETVWTFGMSAGPASRARGGIAVPLLITNGGSQPVEFLVGPTDSGAETRLRTFIPADLRAGMPYLGQFTYSQLGLGERVAGRQVFAGVAFTGIFKFTVPA